MKHITLAYNQGKFSDHIKFYIPGSMVTCFWPKHNKCLKIGSKCQIFASLGTRITIFSDLKHIMMVTEIPRNGVIQCIEIAPNDLLNIKILI